MAKELGITLRFFNNKKVPQGSYIWKITYKEFNSDGRQEHVGYINVLK